MVVVIPFLSGVPLVLFDHQRTLPGVVRHDQHGAGRDDRQDSADHLHLLQCWLLLRSSSLQGDLIQDNIMILRDSAYALYWRRAE